jgi:hypothetical protein
MKNNLTECRIEIYLTLWQLDVATRDSIIGNDLVVSPGDNVTIRITVNPMCASQDTQEESKGESMINSVIVKQRKAFDTLWPKRQIVSCDMKLSN